MDFFHASPLYGHCLPSNVTLKLSDGSIMVQKMMLACVSPVFEGMFNGFFKETKSEIINLPNESYKVMKLLLDIVFEGSCEMESLDDVIPLMEVVERYQINKAPIQQMCDEAILSQMSPRNYSILLPRYVNLMQEESIMKAADMVMDFTDNDFVADHIHTRSLPEEILLHLLHHKELHIHDVEIFDFLVYWHNYQTTNLGKSLQLTTQILACVRYTRFVPQILSSRVASCDLVDKNLLNIAFQFIYTSCDEIGDDHGKCFKVPFSRRPNRSMNLDWESYGNVVLSRAHRCNPHPGVMGCFDTVPLDKYIIKSAPLTDEIHCFKLLDLCFNNGYTVSHSGKLLLAVRDATERCLLSTPIVNYNLVTVCIYGKFLFLKLIDCSCNVVLSTFNVTGNAPPFSIWICRPAEYNIETEFSFRVH